MKKDIISDQEFPTAAKSLGQVAYEAFINSYSNAEWLPPWDDCIGVEQERWALVAASVVTHGDPVNDDPITLTKCDSIGKTVFTKAQCEELGIVPDADDVDREVEERGL